MEECWNKSFCFEKKKKTVCHLNMDLISLPPCSRHLDNNMTDSSTITETFHISTAFLATVSLENVKLESV